MHLLTLKKQVSSSIQTINMFQKLSIYHLTFPLQVIAIVDELQGIRLIWSLNVVHVDVQVIRRFQEVIREHRPLALIQGEVHVWGDQSATLTLSHGLTHIQSGWRIWTDRPTKFRYRIKLKNTFNAVYLFYLLVLLSVRPHDESTSPSSGSGLQRKTWIYRKKHIH